MKKQWIESQFSRVCMTSLCFFLVSRVKTIIKPKWNNISLFYIIFLYTHIFLWLSLNIFGFFMNVNTVQLYIVQEVPLKNNQWMSIIILQVLMFLYNKLYRFTFLFYLFYIHTQYWYCGYIECILYRRRLKYSHSYPCCVLCCVSYNNNKNSLIKKIILVNY